MRFDSGDGEVKIGGINRIGIVSLEESRQVGFLTKLVALKPGKTVQQMIRNVMQGRYEGKRYRKKTVTNKVMNVSRDCHKETAACFSPGTLKSMLVLSSELSQRTLSGSLLKYFLKLTSLYPLPTMALTVLRWKITESLCGVNRQTLERQDLIGWAMSSLTLKGKPLEQASHVSSSSSAPYLASASTCTLETHFSLALEIKRQSQLLLSASKGISFMKLPLFHSLKNVLAGIRDRKFTSSGDCPVFFMSSN
ncbi:unnamed protein product [Cochlearia groenlandica]